MYSDSTIENYDIAASADLHSITITGIRKRQHGKIVKGECRSDMVVTKTVKLPAKHYCWNGQHPDSTALIHSDSPDIGFEWRE